MKSVEDLAREIHNECFIDVSQSERPKLQWDIDLASALIRADREAVIDECKIAGMRYLDNLENAALVSDDTGCPNCMREEWMMKDDEDYIAEQRLKRALRLAESYDGPLSDYERAYTIGAVVQELKVREESLRVLAAAYRAEKKRTDDLEAENARLREAINDAHRFLSEFKVVSDEDSMGSAFFIARTSEDWYYILLNKLSSLSQKPPIFQDNPSEIDPHGVEYGVFKLDGEFPS